MYDLTVTQNRIGGGPPERPLRIAFKLSTDDEAIRIESTMLARLGDLPRTTPIVRLAGDPAARGCIFGVYRGQQLIGQGLMLELCEHGSVTSYAEEHEVLYAVRVRLASQYCEAVDAIHSCGVSHGDHKSPKSVADAKQGGGGLVPRRCVSQRRPTRRPRTSDQRLAEVERKWQLEPVRLRFWRRARHQRQPVLYLRRARRWLPCVDLLALLPGHGRTIAARPVRA